jgi:hypothetical protein
MTKSGCEILASGSWLLASNANEILVKLRITVQNRDNLFVYV